MTLWIENLLALAKLVGEKIELNRAETAEFDHKDYDGWRQRSDAADARMLAFFTDEHGARFTERPPHDHRVQMAGIRSTSTGGWTGALQNWKRAAEAKIAAEAGAVVRCDPINLQGSGPAPIEPREG